MRYGVNPSALLLALPGRTSSDLVMGKMDYSKSFLFTDRRRNENVQYKIMEN